MQATRAHILDYLDNQRSASAQEMSAAFGMTRANLRHHLGVLQEEGLVHPVRQRGGQGRGRPEILYGLSAKARGNNMEGLAAALLKNLERNDLPKRPATRLKRVAKSLSRQSQDNAKRTITQRLVAAVQRLEELGYQPSWEAQPGGPKIVLGHCPYAQIIDEHPALCQMDAHLLEDLTAEKVEQTIKLQPGSDGMKRCVFSVRT